MALQAWIADQLDSDDESLRRAKRIMISDVTADDGLLSAPVSMLLPLLRILALDAREAFVVLGTTRRGLSAPFNSWAEQKAAKLFRRLQEDLQLEDVARVIETVQPLLPPLQTPPHLATSSDSSLLAQVGITVEDSMVTVVPDPSGEGNGSLVLTRPVASFSPLLTIPGAQLFNLDTLRRYSALGAVLHRSQWRKMLDDEGEALLLACLVYERALGPKTHWAVFSTFPSSFPYVPTNWSEEELSRLSGTSLIDEVMAKQASMETFVATLDAVLTKVAAVHTPVFDTVFEALNLSSSLSLSEKVAAVFSREALQWARCIVDSRAFHLNYKATQPNSNDRVLLTLAPVADMINHTSRGTHVLTRRIDAQGQFTLETGAALGENLVGCEILMSYGPLQSWELLLSYGFVPASSSSENENDRLPFTNLSSLISMQPPAEDEDVDEYSEKFEAWKRMIVDLHALNLVDALFIPRSGVVPPTIRAILRLCLAEADEFPALEADPFATGPDYLEKRVSETLANYAASFLDSVDPASDDDETGGTDASQTVETLTRRRMASTIRGGLLDIAKRLYACEAVSDGDDDADAE